MTNSQVLAALSATAAAEFNARSVPTPDDPASSPRPQPRSHIVSQPIKVGVAIRYLRRLSNWKIWNGKAKPRASFRTFRSVYDGVESENKIIELP